MALLQTYLSDLLIEHECVIVPCLGGFVTNNKPASLNKRTNRIVPPSKEVGFNQRLVHNDGLLTQWLRIHEHVSYDAAATLIADEVAEIKTLLAAGKQYQFDEVGAMFLNEEGNIQFLPSNERNFLTSSFGLEPVSLSPVQKEVVKEVETKQIAIPVVTETVEVIEPTGRKRSGWRNLAAAAAIPLLIAAGSWVQTGVNSPEAFSAFPLDLNRVEITSTYQPRFEEEGIHFEAPADGNPFNEYLVQNPQNTSFRYSFERECIAPDGVEIIREGQAPVVASTDQPADISASTSNLKLYFIVGGAFREKSNATDYVANLNKKGYDASIFGMKGDLHMVSLGSYTSKRAAKKALAEVRVNENKNAWLKRQ